MHGEDWLNSASEACSHATDRPFIAAPDLSGGLRSGGRGWRRRGMSSPDLFDQFSQYVKSNCRSRFRRGRPPRVAVCNPVPVFLDLLRSHDQLRIYFDLEEIQDFFDLPPLDRIFKFAREACRVCRRKAASN